MTNSLTAPLSIQEPYTALPSTLPTLVSDLAEKVTQGATSRFEQAVMLQDWFRDNGGFRYSLKRAGGDSNEALLRFLVKGKGGRVGYCEQFAAAFAVMARTLGHPGPRGDRLPGAEEDRHRPLRVQLPRHARVARGVLPRVGLGDASSPPRPATRPAVPEPCPVHGRAGDEAVQPEGHQEPEPDSHRPEQQADLGAPRPDDEHRLLGLGPDDPVDRDPHRRPGARRAGRHRLGAGRGTTSPSRPATRRWRGGSLARAA